MDLIENANIEKVRFTSLESKEGCKLQFRSEIPLWKYSLNFE
jgi:hypothetical protein